MAKCENFKYFGTGDQFQLLVDFYTKISITWKFLKIQAQHDNIYI